MVKRLMLVITAAALLVSATSVPHTSAPTAGVQGRGFDWCC